MQEYNVPEKYIFNEPAHRGRIEELLYDSKTYFLDEHKPLPKRALVYLPYGYDETKKYNVYYLMHGGSDDENCWFQRVPHTVDLFDNMFDSGYAEPAIVVTPTFYPADRSISGDPSEMTEFFASELRYDLVPAVESKYSTYACGDVSEENLRKTRTHRSFAGFSMGSMTTYRAAFHNCYDIFAWFGPFSGCGGPRADREHEKNRILKTLAAMEKDYPLSYLFCCNGDRDIAYPEHIDIMNRVEAECPYLRRGENYDFMTIPGGEHNTPAVHYDIYRSMDIFFKKIKLC